MSRTTADRFARLKALQRPPTLPLSGHEVGLVRNPVEEESFNCASGVATGSERLALILGASVKQNRHGEHLSLHCWHGDHAPCAPDAAALRLLAPDAPEDVADAQQWLFLDTETTGLAGGTGTYPFLVGLAWWEGGGLEVEQLFMREYSEERSLLTALAERLAERPVLVTFNGKSFDWPLLETRYRMTRTIPPPAPRAHLDFLHPARNLWRLRLGPVKLSQLERHVLGWDRGADVVSELIPRIYPGVSPLFGGQGQMHSMSGMNEADMAAKQSVMAVGFGLLNLAYVAGALLALVRRPSGIRWAGLLVSFVLLRSAFLGTLENPKPRYTLECYSAIIVLASSWGRGFAPSKRGGALGGAPLPHGSRRRASGLT